MYRKLARAAAATIAAAVTAAAGPGAAQAALAVPAAIHVPCSVTALAGAMNSASIGDTLSLAPGCVYRQADLPAVDGDLAITGNGAILKQGGLEVDSGTLTVTNLNFRKGGIVVNRIGNLTVNGGTFTGGTATDGGAIDVNSPGAGALTVNGATFTRNSATDDGGAIFDYSEDSASITDCTFTGNHAGGAGGAIFANPQGQTSLSDVVVHGNSATTGGGIYDFALIDISGSQISGNHAAGQGGGLYIADNFFGQLDGKVTGTVFRGNSAQEGAGIYNERGNTDITDSTISGNDASESGGGIYVDRPAATVTLTASTVLRNRPDNCAPANSITGCTRSRRSGEPRAVQEIGSLRQPSPIDEVW